MNCRLAPWTSGRRKWQPRGAKLDDAVAQYRDYRFVVALESERRSDYITEKLINAMLSGAIPIYWGAPEVGAHFNQRSFIDVGALRTSAPESSFQRAPHRAERVVSNSVPRSRENRRDPRATQTPACRSTEL